MIQCGGKQFRRLLNGRMDQPLFRVVTLLTCCALLFGIYFLSSTPSQTELTGRYQIQTKAPSQPLKSHTTTQNYVFMPSRGRLGNHMFQYVSTLGIAHHSNRTAVFDNQMLPLKTIFPKMEIKVLKKREGNWTKMKEKAVWDFDEKFFDLPPATNIFIDGYLISFRYFEEISDWLLKNVLTHINTKLSTKAQQFVGSVKRQFKSNNNGASPRTVCVQVRRGDKANKKVYEFLNLQLPGKEEILGAMVTMENKHKQVVFIVASDSLDWCKKHLSRKNVYFSNMTSFQEDFVLMSSCDDVIMTVGTFGWWASWLTWKRGGSVMYYKYPFVPGSPRDKLMNRTNSFMADWIPYPE